MLEAASVAAVERTGSATVRYSSRSSRRTSLGACLNVRFNSRRPRTATATSHRPRGCERTWSTQSRSCAWGHGLRCHRGGCRSNPRRVLQIRLGLASELSELFGEASPEEAGLPFGLVSGGPASTSSSTSKPDVCAERAGADLLVVGLEVAHVELAGPVEGDACEVGEQFGVTAVEPLFDRQRQVAAVAFDPAPLVVSQRLIGEVELVAAVLGLDAFDDKPVH